MFLKGVLKHTLVSHVHTTLLTAAAIIVTRHCSSILRLNAEPPLLDFHRGNHVRFDHSQKRKGRKIRAGEASLFHSNPRKSHVKTSGPRFTSHSGCALYSVTTAAEAARRLNLKGRRESEI